MPPTPRPIPHRCATSSTTSTRMNTLPIIELSLKPVTDDARHERAYQLPLEASTQRHCISINLPDGTKRDNGFNRLINNTIN